MGSVGEGGDSQAMRSKTLTIIAERSSTELSPARKEAVDRLLGSRQLIGNRGWGMAQLYYRAGLSQQEIAEVFGLSRQAVTRQLERAVRMVERARELSKKSASR